MYKSIIYMVYLKNGTVITNREGFFNKSEGKNVTGTICLGTLYINVEEIAAVHYKLDKEW